MIRSLLFLANMVVTGIPSALLFIPWCWITGNVLPLYKATRFMLSSSCRVAGVRLRAQGLERIPRDRACIFMSNHVSNLDPPALISLIPGRTSAFMKRSLMNLPILGTGFRQGEFIAVDRSGNPADAQRSVAEAQRVLAKGMHITTFVEGTRSPDGRMLPFKKGPFFLAKASGAPCIPVSIYGTETMLRKGSLRIHPGAAHVIFHEPIDPAALRHARRAHASRPRRHRLRPAGVDAHVAPPPSAILTIAHFQNPMIVSLLVFVTILVLALPTALVLIPFTLLTGNVRPLYAAGSWIARVAMFVAGIRIRIEGRENIPSGRACIFMANHVSNLDAPALMSHLPGRTLVFLKRALLKLPIVGYAFKLAKFIPVDRDGEHRKRAGSRCRRHARPRQRAAHHNFCRGHALARRPHAALQERHVLSREGFRRALHSRLDLWNGEDYSLGQQSHPSRRCARRLPPAHRSRRLRHTRGIIRSRPRSDRLWAAGVDARIEARRNRLTARNLTPAFTAAPPRCIRPRAACRASGWLRRGY